MNVRINLLPLAVIATVVLIGCGKEAPAPQSVQAVPAPTPVATPPAAVPPGSEPANMALAAKSGCLACHAVDKKHVGPSYQDIAKKYTTSDEALLVAKVKAGSKGVWGPVPMPPNIAVKDEDIKTLVNWILAGAE